MQHLQLFKKVSLTAMFTMPLVACAGHPVVVQQGDKVEMSFNCRLPDGSLAATTRPDAELSGETRSPLYLPRTGPAAVSVTAGLMPHDAVKQDRKPFEYEIRDRLAELLPGLKEGQQANWQLEAERYPATSPKDRFVKIATVRKRPKEMRLSREDYINQSGIAPEKGQPYVLDDMVPGLVNDLTDTEVIIRFTPTEDKSLLITPFGPVTIREMPDQYELVIGAVKGRLLRTGGMAGRISDVNDVSITIDYGHPFAGEKLNCDVNVVKVEQQQQKKSALQLPAQPRQATAKTDSAPPAVVLDPKIAGQHEEALLKLNKEKHSEPADLELSGLTRQVGHDAGSAL